MRGLLLASFLVLWVPLASAHASPDPMDVEVHILADDVDDAYAAYDGFDIQDVYVREADIPAAGQGIVVRVYVYSAFAPVPVASTLGLEIDVNGATFRVTTSDLAAWDGDAPVIESEFEADDMGVQVGYIQVLLPYAAIGAQPGGSLSGFAVRSYADEDLRDLAPGGRPVPGTNGAIELPGDSTVIAASVSLGGPVGYTESRVTRDGARVTVAVTNRITSTGQHITLSAPTQAGWSVPDLDQGASVDAGQHPTFIFNATGTAGAAPFEFYVRTDTGGRETFQLAAPGTASTSGIVPPPETTTTRAQDSPAPVAIVLGALALALRRRR